MDRLITKTKKIFKEHPIKIILAALCILSFIGITLWHSSAPVPIHNWNQREIARIVVADPDNFTFAVMSDNKGNRSVFEPLLRDIARDKEIAFALDDGDLVQKGTVGHYRRFLNQVQENLAIPFLTAIGNHDLNNNGSNKNYQDIFGPTYYSFQVGKGYFIVLDATTQSGFDKAERQWLEKELQRGQAAKARFVFMHVPIFDPRGGTYHKSLPDRDQKDLLNLFRRYKVTHLFASHLHGYFSGVWAGVPYTITGGAGGSLQGKEPEHFFYHYVKVRVRDGKADVTVRRINAEDGAAYFFDLMEDYALRWVLLLAAGILLLSLVLSKRVKSRS
ncbi:MAG: metallophosphoesterase [Deltaproteobacteria bacterium]|nr:metallophosphoesterase [Deltaproteobacteria bacterium]